MPTIIQNEYELRSKENKLFFKRFLSHPIQLGTLAPISPKLAALAASLIKVNEDDLVIEVGSGTGRLTRALLDKGIHSTNLTALELDPEFCDFLRSTLPQLKIIEGDAVNLPSLIPPQQVGKIAAIVSIIPLMYLSLSARKALMEACLKVLKPQGTIFHVTYSPKSPLKGLNLPLHEERVGKIWLNAPPGFVWKYQPLI